MRISDWSSDVCSSDLVVPPIDWHRGMEPRIEQIPDVLLPTAQLLALIPAGSAVSPSAPDETGGAATAIDFVGLDVDSSEERRVGHECDSTCRSRWWPKLE